MIPRRFLSITSALSLFSQACSAQTITLTTHVSACSATYTSGTSTTVIQSTVTVEPTPWTDVAANGGAPFVIRLQQVDVSGYPDQDTAPYWLTANGNTTTNSSLAIVYTINAGRLTTLNGSHIATNFNVVDQAFGITDYNLPINTTFSVRNRMLNWTNPLFTNGTAQFYKLPPGLLDNALILAKFLGPMEAKRSWSPVVLHVEPLVINGTGVGSSSASASSGVPLSTVSDLLPGASSSSVASGTVLLSSVTGSAASSSAAVIASSIESQLSSKLSSVESAAASSSAASVLSSIAGGASSGPSSSGGSIPVSSAASVSGIGPVIVPSSSTASSTAASSSVTPQTTYSCPADNGDMVESNLDGMYELGCNQATSGGVGQRVGSSTNFNDCMTLCDQTDGCVSWTFDGVDSCYVKTGSSSDDVSFQPATQGTVSGIRAVPARPGGTGPASSSASLASSSATQTASSSAPALSSAVSSIVQSVSPAVQSAPSAVQPASSAASSAAPSMSSAANAGSSSIAGASSSVAPILSSLPAISSVQASSSSAPGVASSAPVPGSSSRASSASSVVPAVSSPSASSPAASSPATSSPGASSSSRTAAASSIAASSPAASSLASPSSSGAAAASSGSSASSAPSAAVTQVTYSCPSADGQTIADTNGVTYQIKCNSDTSGGGQNFGSPADAGACAALCDNTNACGAFVYTDTKTCYLKIGGTNYQFQGTSAGFVAGIRQGVIPTSVSSSTATASATGSPIPKCPAMDGQTLTDSRGARYSVSCGRNGQGILIANVGVQSQGINECFLACDRTAGCGALVYSGDATMTQGTCYLKQTAGDHNNDPVASTIAEAVLISGPTDGGAAASSVSRAPAASSSSAAGNGGGGAASSVAASSSRAASASPAPTSGGGSPTVVNPDGSTSTYNGLLASPTRCDFGDPIDTEEDDSYCEIDLPFEMKIYSGSSAKSFPSTNGLLTLIDSSTTYDNAGGLPNPYIPIYAAAPFFDDLIKFGENNDAGIFYQTTSTSVIYEYRLARAGTYETYHFTVSYDSTQPGIFVYRYYDIGGDQGSGSAAIGIQGSTDGTTRIAVNYAFNRSGAVTVGSTLTCNTAVTPATCVLS
ncbi:hypothetical protein AUEXF2481DRAFT_6754 [Aureobasidium subglaciale EXF-2481]|uniref:Apple domain-containing protein n=1 Tax=Aureobasidium subglaciale (strain EXF-2481) TaxID=1043005 RepID=A0A074YCF2_AURSE|nr:uncharacterized protein AUEXF2481DRAFT_6754 [Aureobasidium subglaciale EXF-2481]KAI5212952.1 hypothetical protein E4T38_00006 [Aureobasidium subglaciale]KAI5232619.1 hypothetical protein E4T40_00006 [Aureobasidium subglaciale]KAI5234735.1 hypothetical protein E4T41_00006 [Aureobasidium subglaciale]KAI5268396.1 hypothetical protein E4T46_00006 [Aureobasidium subglaciale]KEQ93689.1 hypothetical protein AUEXF2481DRAFT_6754 [Aureobasidium subglaciale EXF-2481]